MAIDDALVRSIIATAIGPHPCLRAAREANLFVVPARDRAIELCMPIIPGTVRKMIKIPPTSRIQYEDLEQAACFGMCEAIDSFQPTKTYQPKKGPPRLVSVSTHLFFRMKKRVYEEVQDNHWVLAKPTRSDALAYMSGDMTERDRRNYIDTVLHPVNNHELEHNPNHYGGSYKGFMDIEEMYQ